MSLQKAFAATHSEKILIILAISVSLILSTMASLRSIVNPDGICYLMSAEEIGRSNLYAAMKLCAQSHWPFFSLLIHYLVKFTAVSYMASAFILDAFFSAVSTLMFILIVRAAGGTTKTMWLAAIIFILAHEFNAVREYIIRDHGFWALYLTSCYLFIQYLKKPGFLLSNLWFLTLIIASLFRIEGAIFILLLPFASLLQFEFNFTTRLKHFFQLFLPVILLSVACVLFLKLKHQDLASLGRVTEVLNQIQNGFAIITTRIVTAKTQLALHVLTKDSVSQAGVVFTMMMIGWYIISVIRNLSFGYAILVGYAWIKKCVPWSSATRLAILSYLIVNILITTCFLLERFFLSKRYLIALSLILMLWVPFVLVHLIQNRQEFKNKLFLMIVSVFILISGFSSFFEFGYSKNYIQDAGLWLAQNVPSNAKLYTNDYQLMYYSQHYKQDLYKHLNTYVSLNTVTEGKWKKFDYLALRITKNNRTKVQVILNELNRDHLRSFKNKRGDEILVYKASA